MADISQALRALLPMWHTLNSPADFIPLREETEEGGRRDKVLGALPHGPLKMDVQNAPLDTAQRPRVYGDRIKGQMCWLWPSECQAVGHFCKEKQKNIPKTLKLLMLSLEENSVSLCFLCMQNVDFWPLNGKMKTAVQNEQNIK